TTQDDVRTCSGFAALLNALTRNSKGLRSTGVVAVSCRHELFRPNGLGDLQKGERYRNVDYVVAASIRGWDIRMIKDSFDIACEWRKGFFARIQDLPEEMRPAVPEDEWVFIVPKFHIAAHKESCQANYSSNFTPFCARWDGEHVERLWAYLNGIASSIKEMTAAGRWETIDDFCSDDLLRLLIEAIPAAYDHKADFEAFDRRLRQERPHDVAEWEAMLSRWEADHRSPNPYVLPKTTTTRADVQLRYFMAENQAIADGKRASHDGGPCSFIVLGMEIRQARSSLAAQKKTATTVLQQVDLHKRAAPLLHRLNQFLDLQAVYMPRLASHTSPQPPPTVDTIYSYPLHLPSELAPDIRALVCVEGLAQIEDDLQYAEACEALDELRHALRIRTSYNRAKIKNVTGQVLNTRAREKQATVDEAVNAAKQRYRAARLTLMQLRGAGDWEATLRPLLDEDIVGLNERALTREEVAENERIRAMGGVAQDRGVPLSGVVNPGEGRRTLSWIRYTASTQATSSADGAQDPELRDSLRVEWAKAKARAARWVEQVRLVDEEMRRAITTTRHFAKQWNLRRSRRQVQADNNPSRLDEELDEGLSAYADEHCAMETSIADALEDKWRFIRSLASDMMDGKPLRLDETPVTSADQGIAVVQLAVDTDYMVNDQDDEM
ncbi:hypothetical protein OH77DRAFT_1550647, partial [Trametes cingulata]